MFTITLQGTKVQEHVEIRGWPLRLLWEILLTTNTTKQSSQIFIMNLSGYSEDYKEEIQHGTEADLHHPKTQNNESITWKTNFYWEILQNRKTPSWLPTLKKK